jgi:site-specific recombinase XerC
MLTELTEWFDALRHGRTSPPRCRPCKDGTVRAHITSALAALNSWATTGHQSLREVSRQDVLDALPTQGHRRHQSLITLRSLFRFLKARRLVFTNPTARLRGAPQQSNQPLPIDLDPIRQAINSNNPARAALAALIAFHALRPSQLRAILLTDVRDGRLHLPDQTVLLAEPVRARIAAWLDERVRRWPNTANPYLFVNHHTAIRTTPTHRTWIRNTLGLSPQAIREDRILHEAIATAGDVRRLSDLFGLTVAGAVRYAHTTDQPAEGRVGSGTEAL